MRARTGAQEALFLVDGEPCEAISSGHRPAAPSPCWTGSARDPRDFDGNHPVVMLAAGASVRHTYRLAFEAYAGHVQAPNGGTAPPMGLVGHPHIDTAWLRPLAETWRKCARAFSSAINQMDQLPEMVFYQSSPCHADVVRREYHTSPVLGHFHHIHCWPDPKALAEQWRHVQPKDAQDRRPSACGYGDGGGGPQYETLEIAGREQDQGGCPRLRHTRVSHFMQGVRQKLGDRLPDYVGELHLERHRGTLTSTSGVRQGKRRAELALRDAEWLCAVAALRGRPYPAEPLQAVWHKLLVDQFHDIRPGSPIPEVNDQAIAELAQCAASARALGQEALRTLAGEAPPGSTCFRRGAAGGTTPPAQAGVAATGCAARARHWRVGGCLRGDAEGQVGKRGRAPQISVDRRVRMPRARYSLVHFGMRRSQLRERCHRP
ncbi:MAG: hypothetical protein AB1505_14295 [Candidatus Latescibacterota bacterium]